VRIRSKSARVSEARCPLCRDAVADTGEPLRTCRGCRTAYHEECWGELGGCATLGCDQLDKRAVHRLETLEDWWQGRRSQLDPHQGIVAPNKVREGKHRHGVAGLTRPGFDRRRSLVKSLVGLGLGAAGLLVVVIAPQVIVHRPLLSTVVMSLGFLILTAGAWVAARD
jgi:hypothetical protein